MAGSTLRVAIVVAVTLVATLVALEVLHLVRTGCGASGVSAVVGHATVLLLNGVHKESEQV